MFVALRGFLSGGHHHPRARTRARLRQCLPKTPPPLVFRARPALALARRLRVGAMAKAAEAAEALLELGPLERATLVCRPSKRNRSPYVADVRLETGAHGGREAVAHLPNLDNGGKCVPGVSLLVRRQPGVTPETLGKHGTPKCEVVCQLVRVHEPAAPRDDEDWKAGVWVNAHPRIGEQLAQALMNRGALDDSLGFRAEDAHIFEQVTLKAEDHVFRPDFVVANDETNELVVCEVKQVVDTDVAPAHAVALAAARAPAPVFVAPNGGSDGRSGIFPWGGSNQQGPDGEKVVSARAIKHVDLLARLASAKEDANAASTRVEPWTAVDAAEALNKAVRGKPSGAARVRAVLVFVVGRKDTTCMRPNGAACPSFAAHLAAARRAGVVAVARRIVWEEEGGIAYDGGALAILADLEADAKLAAPKAAKAAKAAKEEAAEPAVSTPPPKGAAKRTPESKASPTLGTPPAKRTRAARAKAKADRTWSVN